MRQVLLCLSTMVIAVAGGILIGLPTATIATTAFTMVVTFNWAYEAQRVN